MGRAVGIHKETEIPLAGESAATSQTRLEEAFGKTILAVGIVAALFSLALTIRCYVRCPLGDEWFAIDSIARGRGVWDWLWLFGQHNEHRIAIPRALIWLDTAAFHGMNVSLSVEMWLALVLHWAAVCYVLERFSSFPTPLKRTLEGLFAFCIFHPNQSDNLTEPFQIAFILPLAIATVALLGSIFFFRLRRKRLAALGLAGAPVLAAWNMAGGLLIGPVVLLLAIVRRLPWRVIAFISAVFLLSAGAYLWHFKPPDSAHPPLAALAHPKDIFVYILTYFGASWTRILPHKERTIAFLSLISLLLLAIRSARRRRLSDFEWFCFAECGLMLSIAFATALGRVHFGVGQAFESRYQTAAMLYWAALGGLVAIAAWRRRPSRLRLVQIGLLLAMLLSTLTFFRIWTAASVRADLFRGACSTVVNGSYNEQTARTLYARDAGIEPGATFLRKLWR